MQLIVHADPYEFPQEQETCPLETDGWVGHLFSLKKIIKRVKTASSKNLQCLKSYKNLQSSEYHLNDIGTKYFICIKTCINILSICINILSKPLSVSEVLLTSTTILTAPSK